MARRLLQDPKVDVNCQMTKTGSTPLLIAIKKGKDGANSDGSLGCECDGDGVHVCTHSLTHSLTDSLLTQLTTGRDFLSMLLDAKADVEKKDKRGDTPLIKAAWY